MRRRIMKFGMKHKRIMAAVAGAAVISATMLPGMPAKAQALSSPKEIHEASAKSEEIKHRRAGDPVLVVRNNAATFGFDSQHDRFSLLSSSGSKAIVQVRSNGQTFKVDLTREDGEWTITTIRGIGDSTHPATYTPAKLFTSYATLAPTDQMASQILYHNVNLGDWTWNESAYPKDMSFGLLMKDPRTDGSADYVPANVLNQMKAVNFSHQFVLYAHLGTVAPKGYGIAIEKVVHYGNDIAVTLRTKSPRAADSSALSVLDTYITLDRSVLANGSPTNITVYDQNGVRLVAYTVNSAYY
ncbi:hypothetical protein AXX12_06370 [Anaerosporomusa subterranea]|uniref:PrcB C-terminal domain-containing protein n=1 Tax=Anaerosporomusa subterranea TaxID=1794912 RepID=A0A154BQD4_ANASB|nr:hypothetical protein [Anaerosporomusa subterranea]KYZ76065.1 hypothetical protein AXX12_06370 [Anaerosporomusa subterranea]